MEYVPTPEPFSVTAASAVFPSENVTLPVGVDEAETVAVNVTFVPKATLVADGTTVVVVGSRVLSAP